MASQRKRQLSLSTGFSTHDPACDHCRSKKIRCDRDRPACGACRRNDTPCDFSDSGKRINQTKLLVSNVSELEERLGGIETALYHLVDRLDHPKRRRRSYEGSYGTPRTIRSSSSSDRSESMQFSLNLQGKDADSIQGSVDDHFEPSLRGCSVPSLCEQLRDDIVAIFFEHSAENGSPVSAEPSTNACVSQLLDCFDSTQNLEILNDGSAVELPPRSLLAMACIPFFQSEDPATNLFDQDIFRQNVERIYDGPYRPEDAPWAICFNLIILLGLSVDQHAKSSGEFLKPFLLNAKRAFVSLTKPLTLRLINVQALALLSIVAQQYFQYQLPELIVEQSCMLYKSVQSSMNVSSNDGDLPFNDKQSTKVLISLYTRDKYFSLSRNKNCCLPAFDWSPSLETTQDLLFSARLPLAHIQEKAYIHLYSKKSARYSSGRRAAHLLTLNQHLNQWAEQNNSIITENQGPNVDLHLEFRSTRVIVLRLSPDQHHQQQVLSDARIASKLLVESKRSMGMLSSMPIHRFAEAYSPAVFSALATHIFRSYGRECKATDVSTDVELLQSVVSAFQAVFRNTEPESYCKRLLGVYQRVLSVVSTVTSATAQHQDQRSRSPSMVGASFTVRTQIQHALERKASNLRRKIFQFEKPGNASATLHQFPNYPTPSSSSTAPTTITTGIQDSSPINMSSAFPLTATTLENYDGATNESSLHGNTHHISQANEAEPWRLPTTMEPIFDTSADPPLNLNPEANRETSSDIFSWVVD